MQPRTGPGWGAAGASGSLSLLSPDPATKSLRDLWQVAAPALGLSFPMYTPQVLDLSHLGPATLRQAVESRVGPEQSGLATGGRTSSIPQYLPG